MLSSRCLPTLKLLSSNPCDDCPYDQENGNEMRMNIERTHEERRPYNCGVRDSDKDNRDSHRKHTETEYEESYFAVMGDDGRIQFVCKLCDASFSLQKAINEHNMVKHGGELPVKGFTNRHKREMANNSQ